MNADSVTVRPDRRERERGERRRSILEAAERVFSTEGFHEASLAAIAARAGYAVGTLYLSFPDKSDLYGNVLLEKMSRLVRTMEEALARPGDSREGLRAAVAAQFAFHDANRRFFEMFLHQDQMPSSALNPRHWREMETLKRRVLELLSARIKAGQAEGEIRPGDPKLYAVALLGMSLQMIRQWIREKTPGKLSACASFVADCFLDGASGRATR